MMVYLIITIGIACAFGFATKTIYANKGYEGGFAWGFWLGIIGLIVVLTKPENPALHEDNLSHYSMHDSYSNRLNAINKGTIQKSNSANPVWTCICGNKNSVKYDNCTRCNRNRRDAETRKETKKCPHCGAENNEKNVLCFACNKPMSGETPKTKNESTDKIVNENIPDLIAKIAKLHEQGILTEEEFRNKKEELLKKL